MPKSEKLRAQTTPEDGALFQTGYVNSLFAVQPHKTATDFVREKVKIEEKDTLAGRSIIFDIEKQGTFVEDFFLNVTLPALAVPGDGTFIRYCDFPLWQLIKEVRYTYGSTTLATFTMDNEFVDYLLEDNENKQGVETFSSGNLSPAQRNTLAVNDQVVSAWLPSPWKSKRCHSPIVSATANKIRIHIQFREPGFVIQTDGTKPTNLPLTNINLETQFIHVTGAERAEATSLTLRREGLSYLFEEENRADYVVPAGRLGPGTPYVISMNEFTGPVSSFHCIIRKTSDLQSNSPEPSFYEIDTSIFEDLTYSLESNGISLFEPTTVAKTLPYYVKKFRSCGPEIQHIILFWDEFPEMLNSATGHISIGNFNNPKLIFNSPVANADEWTVTVLAKSHNWLNHQAGNLQKIWN